MFHRLAAVVTLTLTLTLAGACTACAGDLYDELMSEVKRAIEGKTLASVTFLWMQGERDARSLNGEVYEASLRAVIDQIKADLNQELKVAASSPRVAWINTDDLNDGVNREGKAIKDGLHMSAKGYVKMGQRFANKAIALIRKNS